MGRFVKEAWEGLAMQYSYIELDEYVVMPNHLHGVIVISSETPTTRVTERKSLGRVIGAFKTISTKQINSMRSISGQSIWQRSYYEHIIRNDGELNRVTEYVMNNPMSSMASGHGKPQGVGRFGSGVGVSDGGNGQR